MTSASARDQARRAAMDALDDALPHEARQFTGASILSDAVIETYEAALKAAGYVIVPREPTEAMVEAGWFVISCQHPAQGSMSRGVEAEAYRAMIEAASSPIKGT